jgi:hypothetical protein
MTRGGLGGPEAVGPAGHPVFGDAFGRREMAADEVIARVARCRDDDAAPVQAGDRGDVRHQPAHLVRPLQEYEIVERIGNHLAERAG